MYFRVEQHLKTRIKCTVWNMEINCRFDYALDKRGKSFQCNNRRKRLNWLVCICSFIATVSFYFPNHCRPILHYKQKGTVFNGPFVCLAGSLAFYCIGGERGSGWPSVYQCPIYRIAIDFRAIKILLSTRFRFWITLNDGLFSLQCRNRTHSIWGQQTTTYIKFFLFKATYKKDCI